MLALIWSLACRPPQVPAKLSVDATLVPGCPAETDGRPSVCQWQRVVWAQHLWASGRTARLVVSGNAVYTPFREADVMGDMLVALGVPASAILREPRALHTDENVGYSLRLLEKDWSLGVASFGPQALGCCQMVEAWDGRSCVAFGMDFHYVGERLSSGVPDLIFEPVTDWIPLAEREAQIAEQLGTKPRPSSMVVYMRGAIGRLFGRSAGPMLLP